jgi:hypothetical protein
MRRLLAISFLCLVLGTVQTSVASAQQSVNFMVGGFVPSSMDSRGTTDVLFQDAADGQVTLNRANGIDVGEFHGWSLGGEYLFGLGRWAEGGLGVGWYQKTVPTVYSNLVHADGTEIVQDLKLRTVPFSATVRLLPLGHNAAIQPYIGGGVAIIAWRYSETGEFVDRNNNIFADTLVGSGGEVGPLVVGGVRIPFGAFGVGGEIRWQHAKADLPANEQFLGSTIDLGGVHYLFTMNVRF